MWYPPDLPDDKTYKVHDDPSNDLQDAEHVRLQEEWAKKMLTSLTPTLDALENIDPELTETDREVASLLRHRMDESMARAEADLLRKLLWAGTLTDNGPAPGPCKRKPLWLRVWQRVSNFWYGHRPHVHFGTCPDGRCHGDPWD